MNSARAWLAGGLLLAMAGPLWAQAVVGRAAVNVNRGRGFSLAVTAGWGYGAGWGCGPCWGPAFFPPVTNVTIINLPPPPVIIVPQPIDRFAGLPRFDRLEDLDRHQDVPPLIINRPPPPKKVEPKPPDPKPPEPKPPEPRPQQPVPPPMPPPPRPDADPHIESRNQLHFGKQAFGLGQYGRAAHHFRVATMLVPEEPLAHFLLGQALFSLLKYDEAVAAIREGLRRQPDWPVRGFRPLPLYEGDLGAFPEHLQILEAVLAEDPGNAELLFLYGYQLWFDGRREEAAEVFERAAPGMADPTLVELFLKHQPPRGPMF